MVLKEFSRTDTVPPNDILFDSTVLPYNRFVFYLGEKFKKMTVAMKPCKELKWSVIAKIINTEKKILEFL